MSVAAVWVEFQQHIVDEVKVIITLELLLVQEEVTVTVNSC